MKIRTSTGTGAAGRAYAVVAAGLLAAVLASGCRRPQVRTAPEMPALDVPPAPDRNTEPTDAQVVQPVPLVDAPARTVERPRTTPPAPPRETRIEPKPEPVPEVAKPSEEVRPGTTLRTTPSDQEAELDRRIRAMLQTALADLNRVDYRKLNPDVRLQYDTAKSLSRQSEEALKAKNFEFAQTMAEKAAALASQLAGR